MEEERRLCYVGMTRAKRNLFLTYARTRKIFGAVQANNESRFLGDIPLPLVERETQPYSYLGTGYGGNDDFYEDRYIDY
jgi:DNA helicase-2/ATP-dependent DNA helicase PcrA